MEELIQSIPLTEKVFIRGDLNRHVGKEVGPHTRAHDDFRFGVLNNEGQFIIDFSLAYNFKIVNTYFKKREEEEEVGRSLYFCIFFWYCIVCIANTYNRYIDHVNHSRVRMFVSSREKKYLFFF